MAYNGYAAQSSLSAACYAGCVGGMIWSTCSQCASSVRPGNRCSACNGSGLAPTACTSCGGVYGSVAMQRRPDGPAAPLGGHGGSGGSGGSGLQSSGQQGYGSTTRN